MNKYFSFFILIFSIFLLLLSIKIHYDNISYFPKDKENHVLFKRKFKLNEENQIYCKNLLEEDLYILANENYKPKYNKFRFNKPDKNKCIEIFNYGNTNTMSWLSDYYEKKSEILLNKFIRKIENNFFFDTDFIKLIHDKNKNLKEISKNTVTNKLPNPKESQEIRIYMNNRYAALNYAHMDILKGIVSEYCLKTFERNCYNNIYDRKGLME